MVPIVLSVLALVLLAALTVTIWWAVGTLSRSFEAPEPAPDLKTLVEKLAKHDIDLQGLAYRQEQLTLAVSDGIDRVDRAEKRVQKTIQNARRLVRESGLEHPALEAEYEEIREDDGGGSEPAALQLLPPSVEEDTRQTGIPGITHADLARLHEEALNALS